jgi:magnesium chelatase family protein
LLATIPAATLLGAEGTPVAVEVHVSNGLPAFTIVGLPDAACREARDRVRAAFLSSGLPWPMRRVTVNLAPSDMRKGGAGLDLAIAVGLLVATGVVGEECVEGCAFFGELGLDGSIRAVPGILALVDAVVTRTVVVPFAGIAEGRLVPAKRVLGARTLVEVVDAVSGRGAWREPAPGLGPSGGPSATRIDGTSGVDLADVRGQLVARRAVEIAAAGGHHLLLVGPPGAGKTLLARSIAGLLPNLSPGEALETTKIHSAAGIPLPAGALVDRPPFRAPHHASSAVALIGGGTARMRPGEVSLATNGVLFLDELGEFPPSALETLRQPIEEASVLVARARAAVRLPARFLLVAATNPCPCGEGGAAGSCRCSPAMRERYARRLSAPLLDRFDLLVAVERPLAHELLVDASGETSTVVASRVAVARQRAQARGVRCNAEIPAARLDEQARLSGDARRVLVDRLRSGSLSARGLDRIRRVARTIADLAGSGGDLEREHVTEALELRSGQAMLSDWRRA